MTTELLQPTEHHTNEPARPMSRADGLTEAAAEKINALRAAALEELKPEIGRKLYYRLEEKLADEKKSFREILDWQSGKKRNLDRYTFVLDTRYFEQKFM